MRSYFEDAKECSTMNYRERSYMGSKKHQLVSEAHLTVRLPIALKEKVDELARKDRRSTSDFVRILLEDLDSGKKPQKGG